MQLHLASVAARGALLLAALAPMACGGSSDAVAGGDLASRAAGSGGQGGSGDASLDGASGAGGAVEAGGAAGAGGGDGGIAGDAAEGGDGEAATDTGDAVDADAEDARGWAVCSASDAADDSVASEAGAVLANAFPCVNPRPVLEFDLDSGIGVDTGVDDCDGHWERRRVAVPCPPVACGGGMPVGFGLRQRTGLWMQWNLRTLLREDGLPLLEGLLVRLRVRADRARRQRCGRLLVFLCLPAADGHGTAAGPVDPVNAFGLAHPRPTSTSPAAIA